MIEDKTFSVIYKLNWIIRITTVLIFHFITIYLVRLYSKNFNK